MALTESEILEQQAALDAQQKRLDEALAQARADEVSALRETVGRIAEKRGMTVAAFIQEHLLNAKTPARKPPQRGVAEAKYANPNNANVTWSGKGPKPAWFEAALAQGFDAADMLIRHGRANGNGAHA